MSKLTFYRCTHCGNICIKLVNSGVPVVCCGEPMQELVSNTSDGANEKHLPIINQDGSIVTVQAGSTPHPMTTEHYIQFIVLETNLGYTIRYLNPNDAPKAIFTVAPNEQVISAYSYCNLHSLWQTTLI